jgi:hypothetical protein
MAVPGPAESSWKTSQSAAVNAMAPIPMSFAIPGTYTATVAGGPRLIDPTTVSFQLNPPLVIPANACAELHTASFAYTQPNIASAGVLESVPNGNNRVTIQANGVNWLDIVLDPGLYSYIDVQTAMNIYVRTHDATGSTSGTPLVTGATDLFTFVGIAATQKLVITLDPAALAGGVFPASGFVVSFTNPSPSSDPSHTVDSIGEVLGFPTTGLGSSFTAPAGSSAIYSAYAPNVSDFGATSAYALYASIVTNSYQNGTTGQLLYSFPLGAATPNSVVAWQSTLRLPVPLSAGAYSTINVWTTDQSGNRLQWAYYQAPFQFTMLVSKNKADGSV